MKFKKGDVIKYTGGFSRVVQIILAVEGNEYIMRNITREQVFGSKINFVDNNYKLDKEQTFKYQLNDIKDDNN